LGSLPAESQRAHRLTATWPFGSTLVSPTRLADPADNAGSLVMQLNYVEKNYALTVVGVLEGRNRISGL